MISSAAKYSRDFLQQPNIPAANNVRVLALKDVTDDDSHWAKGILKKHQFSAIPSLPVATLDLPFSSMDEYLASLSANMRKDLRSETKPNQFALKSAIASRLGG